MPLMFVSLPVTDVERAKAFYTAVGFTNNPKFTDHNSACMVVEDGHSFLMVMTREFMQTFTELPLGDPAKSPYTQTSFFLETRDAVDATIAAGIAAGGSEDQAPSDYGFMYQRQLSDPDGNVIEFGWMDPVAAEQGPEAFAAQHQA